jgi:hypothetical protein
MCELLRKNGERGAVAAQTGAAQRLTAPCSRYRCRPSSYPAGFRAQSLAVRPVLELRRTTACLRQIAPARLNRLCPAARRNRCSMPRQRSSNVRSGACSDPPERSGRRRHRSGMMRRSEHSDPRPTPAFHPHVEFRRSSAHAPSARSRRGVATRTMLPSITTTAKATRDSATGLARTACRRHSSAACS